MIELRNGSCRWHGGQVGVVVGPPLSGGAVFPLQTSTSQPPCGRQWGGVGWKPARR